jgi:hypothetical protein
LQWKVTGADTVTLKDLRTGETWSSLSLEGTKQVSPPQTTNYSLTAKNASAEIGQTVTVRVGPCLAPEIQSFTAAPVEISRGGTATLSWQVRDATGVTITGIPGDDLGLSGTRTVAPYDSTQYTLTATNRCGTTSRTVTVTVIVPSPTTQVKIKAFTANPIRTVKAGDPVTLHWETESALQVVITGVSGALPVSGSIVVNPQADTLYTLIAYGERSETQATIQVRVGSNNPPVAEAGPDRMALRTGSVTLDGRGSYDPDGDPITSYHWEVVGSPSSLPLTSDSQTPTFTLPVLGTYTFKLTVTDNRGASGSDTVRVEYIGQ